MKRSEPHLIGKTNANSQKKATNDQHRHVDGASLHRIKGLKAAAWHSGCCICGIIAHLWT